MSELTWVQLAQGAAAIITILATLVLGPLVRLVWKIRTNDLHHMDMKIDDHHKAISGKVATVAEVVIRVEDKLDEHIQWHMNNPSR